MAAILSYMTCFSIKLSISIPFFLSHHTSIDRDILWNYQPWANLTMLLKEDSQWSRMLQFVTSV